MILRRLVPTSLAVLALLALLAGCGSDDVAAPPVESPPATMSPKELAAIRAQEGASLVADGDVRVYGCEDGTGHVEVTNRDSVARKFYVPVYFSDSSGVRFGEDAEYIEDVAPGETVREETSSDRETTGATCRVGQAMSAPMTFDQPPVMWTVGG